MDGKDLELSAVNARLVEAAESGQAVEVILVVRGRIRPVRGAARRRWRMRVDRDHVLTFHAESVVAATPIPRPAPKPRTRVAGAAARHDD